MPAVLDLLSEVVLVLCANHQMDVSSAFKVPHERHVPKLRRFHDRFRTKYARSLFHHDNSRSLDLLDERISILRKASRWMRLRLARDVSDDGRDGDAGDERVMSA